MTQAQFLLAFNPVIEAFGKQKFPIVVLERIHSKVLDLTAEEMQELCNMVIDMCDHAPRTHRVIELANIVRARRKFTFRTDIIETQPIHCTFCNDVGIHCVTFLEDGFETLMRCQCREGVAYDIRLPQWQYRLSSIFNRRPCPIEWFKPAVLETRSDGSIKLENINRRRDYWKAKKDLAVGYWEQASKEGA